MSLFLSMGYAYSRLGVTAQERQPPRTDSVNAMECCVFCYCGLEKMEEESDVGHFDNESKTADKKIPVTTRTPDGQNY